MPSQFYLDDLWSYCHKFLSQDAQMSLQAYTVVYAWSYLFGGLWHVNHINFNWRCHVTCESWELLKQKTNHTVYCRAFQAYSPLIYKSSAENSIETCIHCIWIPVCCRVAVMLLNCYLLQYLYLCCSQTNQNLPYYKMQRLLVDYGMPMPWSWMLTCSLYIFNIVNCCISVYIGSVTVLNYTLHQLPCWRLVV